MNSICIMDAIEQFESQFGKLEPIPMITQAEKFGQDMWPHRAYDFESENRENYLLFLNAIVVRGLKNAGADEIKRAGEMQTAWKRMLNHVFGAHKATKVVQKLIFELEFH